MKTSGLITLLLLIGMPAGEVVAQKDSGGQAEGPVGIFRSRGEYHQFMGDVKRVAYGEGGSPELQAMVPLLNDIALNKPAGWSSEKYGGQASTLDLLANPRVRDDLEMMDEQYQELQKMDEQIRKRAAEQLRNLDFQDRENLVRQIRQIREQAERDLNSVLLPHQMERLRQIRSRSRLRHRSLVDVITSEPLRSDLEISDEQSGELRKAEREIEAELAREIARLRDRARQRLLSKLKPSQQKKVEELWGDTFDFDADSKEPARKKSGQAPR